MAFVRLQNRAVLMQAEGVSGDLGNMYGPTPAEEASRRSCIPDTERDISSDSANNKPHPPFSFVGSATGPLRPCERCAGKAAPVLCLLCRTQRGKWRIHVSFRTTAVAQEESMLREWPQPTLISRFLRVQLPDRFRACY